LVTSAGSFLEGTFIKAECESGWHIDGDVSDFGNEPDNDLVYDISDDLLGQRSPDGDSDCSRSE